MIPLIVILSLAAIVLVLPVAYWKLLGILNSLVAKMRAWSARLHLSEQLGAMAVGNILDGLIVILVGIILVFTFIPIIESNASTANITNTTTKTFAGLAGWLLPVLAVIGLVYVGIRLFLRKHGKG
jgi:hypothetical protein